MKFDLIETEFQPGSTVYYPDNCTGSVFKMEVKEVIIKVDKFSIYCHYTMVDGDDCTTFEDNVLYSNPELAFKHLGQ